MEKRTKEENGEQEWGWEISQKRLIFISKTKKKTKKNSETDTERHGYFIETVKKQ